MEADWQEKRFFKETNLVMLTDSILCDVTFLVGSDMIEVKAHRFMLASRSPVFYTMFCGELAETSDRIEIQDIEADTMNTLLRFIYAEYCEINGESVMALLYAAKKYGIKRLEQKCQTFLLEQMSTENVCDIFIQAHFFDIEKVKEDSLKFIQGACKMVLKTEGFVALPRELLREILKTDVMDVTEDEVYDGCKKWATHQLGQSDNNMEISHTDIRNELGDLLYLIRFPTMSEEYFSAMCIKDDILTSDEKENISKFMKGVSKDLNSKFDLRKRKFMWRQQCIGRFDADITHRSYSGKNVHAIDFDVSQLAMLRGINLYTPKWAGQIEGTVTLFDEDKSVIKEKSGAFSYDSRRILTDVLFDEEIPLLPNVRYTIHVVLDKPSACCGYHGCRTGGYTDTNLLYGTFNINYYESDVKDNESSVKQGQIPYLILCLAYNT